MENLICQIILSGGIRLEVYQEQRGDNSGQVENSDTSATGETVAPVTPRRTAAAWVANAPVNFGRLPESLEQLSEETALSGYERYGDRFRMSFKAMVSHVRHRYTNYEALLRQLECMPGGRDAYEQLKERVDRLGQSTLEELYGEFPVPSSVNGVGS